MRLPFPLRSSPVPFRFQGEPRLINVYPEELGPEHKSPVVFRVIPGLKTFATPTDDPCRGLIYLEDEELLYSLHGSRLFKVTSAGSVTAVPGAVAGTLPAIMARNDATSPQIAIASDLAGYVVDVDAGRVHYLDFDGKIPTSVAILNQRFIWTFADGSFRWSNILDGLTNDPLDFATAEQQPDGLRRAYVDLAELYLFGTRTTEVWRNVDSAAVFEPAGGAFIEKGLGAKHSVATSDNAPHFVGHDGSVYRLSGYQATRVSSHAVERAIKAVSDKDTIKGYAYTDEGHAFYVLTCSEWTWVLDQATGYWHERKTYQKAAWRAWPYAYAFDKHLTGDDETGRLLELDSETHADAGVPIRAELWLPDVSAFPNGLSFDRLDIDCAMGVGTAATADPKIMVDWSDDGGATWANERMVSVGATGKYAGRVRVNRLGTCRSKGRRFRFAMTDPVVRSFMLADVQASEVVL